jgi:hypothetical protein
MGRTLRTERFKLTFHREQKVFSIYAPDDTAVVGPGVLYPQRIVPPGRNATMGNFVSLLQRAILDRPGQHFTSGIYRATAPNAAFLQEKPHITELPCVD